MRRQLSHLPAVLLAATAACAVPSFAPPGSCEVNGDCDAGEICGDDGICYGNPPDLRLAAVVLPPDNRPDLVQTEIPGLQIAADGTVVNAQFGAAVRIQGRVLLSSAPAELSIAATLRFRQTARITGGEDFVGEATSVSGRASGEFSYSILLPRTESSDTFSVTISPSRIADNNGPAPATLAPPGRATMTIGRDLEQDFVLADQQGLKRIVGYVQDSYGVGVAGLQVQARGRFTADSTLEIASSLGETRSDGYFVISVPISWEDSFDLEVSDPAALPRWPTLIRRGVLAPDPSMNVPDITNLGAVRMPMFAAPQPFVLPIVGPDSGGGYVGVRDATVRAFTELASEPDEVFLATTVITDASGNAAFSLVPHLAYQVDIVPAAQSSFSGQWSIELTPEANPLPAIRLLPRVHLSGQLYYRNSSYVASDVTVATKPSLTFLYGDNVTEDQRLRMPRAFPQGVTTSSGAFLIDVDPALADVPTFYDLEFRPANGSLLPRWFHESNGTPIDPEFPNLDVGTLFLPRASYARGPVLDREGAPVPDAKIVVFVMRDGVVDGPAACARPTPDVVCPAFRATNATANSDGEVLLVLPSP